MIVCKVSLACPAKLIPFFWLEIVLGNFYYSKNFFIQTKSCFLILDRPCGNKLCANFFCNFLMIILW